MNYLQRWILHKMAGVERFLFICTTTLLALLLVSQVAMMNAKVRSFLSRVDLLEGLPYRWPEE